MPGHNVVHPDVSETVADRLYLGYNQRLRDAGIRPSRGHTGTALHNAMADSVIATVKTELSNRPPSSTRLDLELALIT